MNEDQIEDRLSELSGWTRKDDRIVINLTFDGFKEAIQFINRIADLADAADHHPEIFNVYDRVELVLTTHDAGGLTDKDFDLAAQINNVV